MVKSVRASTTAAPDPAPSEYTIAVLPSPIVTVAPLPCLIIMDCEPLVAFSIIHTFLTVLGPKVIVHVESKVPVYFNIKALPSSAAPSAIVVA